jgi:adenylate cyclase
MNWVNTAGRWISLAGIGLSILVSVLVVYKPGFLRILEARLYDTQLRSALLAEDKRKPVNPVIVDIDEPSLAEFGQWPWPRSRIGLLLDKIRELGAVSVGLDMFFPEEDRTSPVHFRKDIERDLGVRINLQGIPAHLMDNDKVLAEILSRGPFVLGFSFVFSENKQASRNCLMHPANVAILGNPDSLSKPGGLFRARDVTCTIPLLAGAARTSGFVNIAPDGDGILRRVPLLMEYNGSLYPNLAIATLMQARGLHQVVLTTAAGGLESIALGKTVIPVDTRGNLLVRFPGNRLSYSTISARDILHGRISRQDIAGEIVFVGTSANGLDEYRATPLATAVPGPQIQAAIVDNILDGTFISSPAWVPGAEIVLVLICGLLSTLLLSRTRALVSLCVIAAAGAGLWFSSTLLLVNRGLAVSALFPLIILWVNFFFLTFLKYIREELQLRNRTRQLVMTQDFTIQCLTALAETRDCETGRHIVRCQHYVKVLSLRLALQSRFAKLLDEEAVELLYRSAPLHDIGKVGIPDCILLKPGILSDKEYLEMKKHTTFGREAIRKAEHMYGSKVGSTFLQYGKEIAYSHHEKWDGTGYPEGLTGEQIPLFARIMAVADVYDAFTTKRRYKPSFTHEEAVEFITKSRGTHFDPDIVDAFCEVQDEFLRLKLKFPD